MAVFENIFWEMLEEYTDFQQKKNPAPEKPWHRRAQKGPGAKNQSMWAKRYKGRYTGEDEFTYSGELNDKIEQVRSGASTYQILSDIDIKHILKNYSTKELPKDKPKRIFSGVVVFWDNDKDSYILKSDERS